MAPRICVVGSVNLDLVARCARLPLPGETLGGATLDRVPGGKGANQALAARLLGAEVRLVACVGDDAVSHEALAQLVAAGVDTSGVRRCDAPTGIALVVVADNGENQIVVAPGANWELDPDEVEIGADEAVLCQLEVPIAAVERAAERARRLFCVNAAPALPLPPALLARADLVVANEHEYSLVAAARGLVATTQGSAGAVLLEGGREVARAVPPPVVAVDGTAAGDAFCAALVVSLLEERPREEALRRACAAGAIAASRAGAQPSLPTAAELDEILDAR